MKPSLTDFFIQYLREKIGIPAASMLADGRAEIADFFRQNFGIAHTVRMQLLERPFPMNGILKWTIVDFEARKKMSRRSELDSIYSPPFYTSCCGYKMRLRLDINGHNAGVNSHMSLHLQLLRGDYDRVLAWPFRLAVTLSLLNVGDGSDFHKCLSARFQDPVTDDMNEIECGFEQFIPQDRITNEGFIMNGAIFLKCQVELA